MVPDAAGGIADAPADVLDESAAAGDARVDGRSTEAGSAASAGARATVVSPGSPLHLRAAERPRAVSGAASIPGTPGANRAGTEPPTSVDPLPLQHIQRRLQQLEDRISRANASLEALRGEIAQIPTPEVARLTAVQNKLEQVQRELRETEAAVDMEQRAIESLKFQTSSGK